MVSSDFDGWRREDLQYMKSDRSSEEGRSSMGEDSISMYSSSNTGSSGSMLKVLLRDFFVCGLPTRGGGGGAGDKRVNNNG